jgi:hypothetical protein
MSERRVLRPMGYGEFINEAFDVYKRNFVLFAGIGAILYIVEGLMETALVNHPAYKGFLSDASDFLPAVAAVPIIKAITDCCLGKEASVAGAWRFVLRRSVPLLLTSLLAMLLFAVGLVALVVPGIVVSVWIFFLWNVMIAEERYYGDAIRRSRELAAGQWVRILNVSLLTLLLAFAVFFCIAVLAVSGEELIQAAFRALTGQAPNLTNPGRRSVGAELFDQMMGAAIMAIATPLLALLPSLLYFDVRVRKEGLDIELLAEELSEDGALSTAYIRP